MEEWKLDDSPQAIYGYYQSSKFASKGLKLNFSNNSFECPKNIPQSGPYEVCLRGTLHLFNTIEQYNAVDVQKLYGRLILLKKLNEKE